MSYDAKQSYFIAEFKRVVIEQAETSVAQYGEIPDIYNLLTVNSAGQATVMPITAEFEMDTEQGQQLLYEVALPELFQELKNSDQTPLCFASVRLAWGVIKLQEDVTDDERKYGIDVNKEKSKREILSIVFHQPGLITMQLYDVARVGQHVDNEGELVDDMQLKLLHTHSEPAGVVPMSRYYVFR